MIVVKMGGAAGVNLPAVCRDVAALVGQGQSVLLAHGGSDETNQLSEQLGHPARMVTSVSGYTSRYTDRATLEIFAMAVNGKINTLVVEELHKVGVNAFGLSGLDGRTLLARRKDAIRIVENGKQRILRDDFTGKIEQVNVELLHTLMAAGLTLVVAPLAVSAAGEALNVDADRAAAMLAGALKAEQLILLTNVPGLMRKFPDESTLIPQLSKHNLEAALSFAEGRMKKKVLGASEALELGVGKVVFADGRVENPISRALQGQGTTIS
jgi:[amino group carrier protein]-L-2-aminoadipate 6-kinase